MYRWYEEYEQVQPSDSGNPAGTVIIAGLIAFVSYNMRDSYPKDDMKRWGWNIVFYASTIVAILAFLKL